MANLNKVMLIGRLTRDPETRTSQGGHETAKFGFAVNNKKKNQQTGQYEDEPVFIETVSFGKVAGLVSEYLRKGSQAYIEGHLRFEQWNDKSTGQKRSQLMVVVDSVQFLGAKGGVGGGRVAQKHELTTDTDNYRDDSATGPDVPF